MLQWCDGIWKGLLSGGFFRDAQGTLVFPAHTPKDFCPWEQEDTGRKCPLHGSLTCLTSGLSCGVCLPNVSLLLLDKWVTPKVTVG